MALLQKVGQFLTGTGTGNIAVTGVGFQPKLVILFGVNRNGNGQGDNAHFSWGAFSGSTQRACVITMVTDNRGTSARSGGVTRDDACFGQYFIGDKFSIGLLDAVSLDADGFTVVPDVAFEASYTVNYLALGGSDLTNAYAGAVALPSGTGNFSNTTPGFQPTALLLAMAQTTGAANSSQDSPYCSLGAFDGTNQWALGFNDHDGNAVPTDTRAIFSTSRCISIPANDTDTIDLDLSGVSLDATGFTLNKVSSSSTSPLLFVAIKATNAKVTTLATSTSVTALTKTGVGFQPSALLLASTMSATTTQTTPVAGTAVTVGAATGAAERAAVAIINPDNVNPSDTAQIQANDKCALHWDRTGANTFAVTGDVDFTSFDSDGLTLAQEDGDNQANLMGLVLLGGAPSGTTLSPTGSEASAESGAPSVLFGPGIIYKLRW